MKIVDLTLPIDEDGNYFCTGHLPWEVKFETEPVIPEKFGHFDLYEIKMYCEPGTRFIGLEKMEDVFKKGLSMLIMKDAILLSVSKEPKKGGNPITSQDIKSAFRKIENKAIGKAIILYTGYGDEETYYEMGKKWELQSPYVKPEAISTLVEHLRENECPLFGYDTPNISWQNTDRAFVHREWSKLKPRPTPRSPEAIKFLEETYSSEKFEEDFSELAELTNNVPAVGGLVNLGKIKKDEFKLIVSPLKLVNHSIVPASAFGLIEI